MKKIIISLLAIGSVAIAADKTESSLEQDFQGLGGNKVLLEKAKALNPEQEVSVVQDRIVPRRNRWEISPEFAGTFGGDTYTKTQNLGINLHYHFNPRWSVGLKYTYDVNKLTAEGESMVDKATADATANPKNPTAPVPTMAYPKSETFALVNWYPIYGKMNLLDKGIAHFDLYAVAGVGTVELSSGSSSSYTAGAGFGVWWTRNFASRLEMRYQNYKAQYFDHETNLDLAVASVQMGWLL